MGQLGFNWQEVQPELADVFKFGKAGETLIGQIVQFKDITTGDGRKSQAVIIRPIDPETGDEHDRAVLLYLTAGLANMIAAGMTGAIVKIVYEGWQKNDRTGKDFQAYRVFVAS